MIGRFGKTLSETFFRSYVEKLYGRPWNEIDPEFARALTASGRRSSTRATFPYPSHGTGAICDGLAREIVAAGGQIRTNSPAERIDLEPAATIASNGSVEAYDHVISTLPTGVLARCVAGAPASVGQAAAQSHRAQHGARVSRHPRQPVLPRAVAVRVRRGVSHGSGRQRRTLVAARLGASGSTEPDRVVHRVLVHPRRRDVGANRTTTSRSSANGSSARATSSPRRRGSAPRTSVASRARIRYRRRRDRARPELGRLLRDLRPSRRRRSPCRPRYERHRRQPAGRRGGRLEGRRGDVDAS